MASEKAPLRLQRFDALEFVPPFEYGEMACGIDNELIGYMQSLGEPNLLPIRPLLGIGVRARLAWELWKARKEV